LEQGRAGHSRLGRPCELDAGDQGRRPAAGRRSGSQPLDAGGRRLGRLRCPDRQDVRFPHLEAGRPGGRTRRRLRSGTQPLGAGGRRLGWRRDRHGARFRSARPVGAQARRRTDQIRAL